MSTGFKATIEKCRKHLGTVGIFDDAKIPLLDGIRDLSSQCLIAVLLGNDTFPYELKRHTCLTGIGPEKIEKMRVRIRTKSPAQDDLDVPFEDLLTEVLKSLKIKNDVFQLPRQVIKALVEAMANDFEGNRYRRVAVTRLPRSSRSRSGWHFGRKCWDSPKWLEAASHSTP